VHKFCCDLGRRIRGFHVCNDPDRCWNCGEPKQWGNLNCKCGRPKMPRHLMGNDSDDRPSSQVRYGN
jgi:hypothetical protein